MAKKAKRSLSHEARGRPDAPFLFVLTHVPTDGLWAWFLQTIQDNGIDQLDCRFIFQHDDAPKGYKGKFTKDQDRASWPRFAAEVRASSPLVVVPIGSIPMTALTGVREPIMSARGYLISARHFRKVEHEEWLQVGTYAGDSKATGAKKGDPKMRWVTKTEEPLLTNAYPGYVIPMFTLEHISATAYAVQAAVNADLDRARRAVAGELEILDEDFEYRTFLHGDELYREWGPVVAVDIETSGQRNEVVRRVSFSDGGLTASIPWDEAARDFLSHLFAKGRIYAFHNSPFDLPRLKEAGTLIPENVRVFDTMFGGVTVQPDLLKGLGPMAPLYLDLFPWKWETIAGADEVQYSAKDALVTVKLAEKLIAIMQDLGTWNLFMGEGDHPGPGVMKTLPMLSESSRIGIRINRPFAEAWAKRMQKHLLRLLKMWNRVFPGYNPLSTTDMRKLFYTEWDLPIQRNEDGISTDELACMKLRQYTLDFFSHPAAANEGWRKDPRFGRRVFDLVICIRDVSKQIGTYALPVSRSTEARIYVQYLPTAKDNDYTSRSKAKGNTSTGRLAAFGLENPRINIQNQPKFARGMYLPDTDDMCLLQADYVRAEPHVMAYSARDEAMISDLSSGDLYTALVQRIKENTGLGIKRKTGKNVFLAGQYLAGGPKKSDMILKQEHVYVSPEECNLIQSAINAAYTNVTSFKQWLINQCDTLGYIRNPFGRVRYFYDGRAAAAVDFWPQSTVGDVMWCVMLEVALAAKQYGGRFTLQVHDSIVVQVPQQHIAAMAADMRRIMSRPFDCVAPGFRIPVDFELAPPGRPWGEVKPYTLAS